MELTPIKCRGKRNIPGDSKKPAAVAAPAPVPAAHPTAALAAVPKRQGSITLLQAPKRKRRKPLSLEERLPLEVLERIFVLSENLSLLRCNRSIYFLLTTRKVFLELIIAAFGDTWDNWFGCVSSEVTSYVGATSDGDRFGGKPEFQVRESPPSTTPRSQG